MNGPLAYKEEPRYEIISGRVVMTASPALNHNRAAGAIYTMFSIYLKGRPCEPFQNNVDLFLGKGNREYKPDMMVVCDPEKIRNDRGIFGAPDLVVAERLTQTRNNSRRHKNDGKGGSLYENEKSSCGAFAVRSPAAGRVRKGHARQRRDGTGEGRLLRGGGERGTECR